MRNLTRSTSGGKKTSLDYFSDDDDEEEEEEAKSMAAICKNKPYSCRICHKSFQTQSILAAHAIKDHPQRQHEYHHHFTSSTLAPAPIPRRRDIPTSQNSQGRSVDGGFMTSDFGHPCPICQRIFASVHDRDAHQRTTHLPQTVAQSSTQANPIFSSPYLLPVTENAASSSSVTNDRAGQSRRNNNNNSITSRGNSSKKCSSKANRHNASSSVTSSSSSSSSKPFQCEVCTRTFSRLSHLTAHEQIHSVEKRFKCSECGKDFLRAASLSEHQRCHVEQK